MNWASASWIFTSFPNSVGFVALPLRMASVWGSKTLSTLSGYCLSGLLRTIQPVVGSRCVQCGETQERLERRHRGSPPVEPERELVEVALEVLVTDAMMGAPEPGLEVAEDAVHSG